MHAAYVERRFYVWNVGIITKTYLNGLRRDQNDWRWWKMDDAPPFKEGLSSPAAAAAGLRYNGNASFGVRSNGLMRPCPEANADHRREHHRKSKEIARTRRHQGY